MDIVTSEVWAGLLKTIKGEEIPTYKDFSV